MNKSLIFYNRSSLKFSSIYNVSELKIVLVNANGDGKITEKFEFEIEVTKCNKV